MRDGFLTRLVWFLLGALLSTLAIYGVAAKAQETFVFELGGGNGVCGEFTPDAGLRYDRDSADTPARFNLSVGPNASCDGQGLSVDAAASKHVDLSAPFYVDLTAAYQKQTFPVEYSPVNMMGVNTFIPTTAEAATLSAGLGWRVGGNWTASLGYNAVEAYDGETMDAISPLRLEVHGAVGALELDFSAIELVRWLSLSYAASERISLSATAVSGIHRLVGPAGPLMLNNQAYAPVGPASPTVYRLAAGWNF